MELSGKIFQDPDGVRFVEIGGKRWKLHDEDATDTIPLPSPEGSIRRESDGSTVVEITGKEWLLREEGVICVNPDAPPLLRVYQKRFVRKQIYLPHEYHLAKKTHLSHEDSITISLNGYSSITPEQCIRYGVVPGAYEAACAAILKVMVKKLQDKFSARVQIIDGASYMGIDGAILSVTDELNMDSLGFSCPQYLFYVKDDDRAVYVAENRDLYAESYIQSLDVLIATGGREQALEHDVSAACRYNKRIHFVDVLNCLSTTGGVPATIVDGNGKVRIDNAAAAFGRNISFYGQNALVSFNGPGDRWEDVFENVTSVTVDVCRRRMSPRRMFH